MYKVLIVCSANSGRIAPFIQEQVEALNSQGVETVFFPITRKGWMGYLSFLSAMKRQIADFQPDLIHAHFGLCGLLANLQCRVPVVVTYHGCDINKPSQRLFSYFSLLRSKFNIFVSEEQAQKVKLFRKKYAVIPCGIHSEDFYLIPKQQAREKLGWPENDGTKKVLFSSDFNRPEKNAALAFDAVKLLKDCELIELKGYNRTELLLLMNACDAGLLTSIREGSPMFIKEMMACGRPLVCTDVGDARKQIDGIDGCKIVGFDARQVSEALEQAVQHEKVSYPAERLMANDNATIARQILDVYNAVMM